MGARPSDARIMRRRFGTGGRGGRRVRRVAASTLVLLGVFGGSAEARITRISIDPALSQSPTFEGRTFGPAGAYEKLRGVAYGELDPSDRRNSVITDIDLAPRNERGMVEYSTDFYILKPVDPAKGNRGLFVEVNNRGNKLFGGLNNSGGGNDPTTAADAGEGFLMKRGYALAWNGWDPSAPPGNNRLTIRVPVAHNPDGSTITGPSYEYIVADNATTTTSSLAYPAASLDTREARLTVRSHLNDTPVPVPADGWEFADDKTIRLLPAGTPFQQSAIYELSYTAKDPVVAGIGLAATRDFVSFLRHARADDFGNPNPLAGSVDHTFTYGLSQPARYMNDFQTLGFNEDERGERVVDGVLNWLGGGDGVAINYRFAQPARTERNRQNHLYPEAIFPFAYPPLDDPVSGRSGGRAVRCGLTNTCPKALEVNSANEYWVKAGSLLHTDTRGRDLPDPPNARFYLISGAQHGTGNAANRGVCQQFQNPTNAEPALRALFVALEKWVTTGRKPPPSRVPRVSDGTAVFGQPQPGSYTGIVPQDRLGFPSIPGVTYNGVITTRFLLDFGPRFDSDGIMDIFPPNALGAPTYPSFVSRTDKDGNEVAGIRLPPVAAPVATTTGWALRRAGFGENDGCEAAGQNIPFATTKAERVATGDPRRSLQERYGTHDRYVAAVARAARTLEHRGLLLPEDVDRYVADAEASDVLR